MRARHRSRRCALSLAWALPLVSSAPPRWCPAAATSASIPTSSTSVLRHQDRSSRASASRCLPEGVPGVTPGVPPEMVKGYREPVELRAGCGADQKSRQRRSRSRSRSRTRSGAAKPQPAPLPAADGVASKGQRRQPRRRGRPRSSARQPTTAPWPGQPQQAQPQAGWPAPVPAGERAEDSRARDNRSVEHLSFLGSPPARRGARRHELYRRHRRPPQRRQVDAVQPARRSATRAGRRHARRHPRPARGDRPARRSRPSPSSTPPASRTRRAKA